ncbi:enoyl-CoA hydratase [Propylenella binzhouense]|uniref:enoyl-CoA hydratase n=1 Tax=Propylenella binzhouense TaxID=2555902 RepID=A0A964WT36_9HYPH|nr:enoyl-CoA hydratase [Propylenella binzhouense]MYZ47435.1 enoyl-CoA hydratase [Propylenella binzhouense]
MAYEQVRLERRGRAALITLNRPKALNALSADLLAELTEALDEIAEDERIGATVITGSERAFAAGADIKEMVELDPVAAYRDDFLSGWERVAAHRKPLVAAVAGYALGGGCELAMMCDFILAADNARFGMPEITLGIIPGIGGTQRLIRSVGKAKAMEMILTGRTMDAVEAERCGLVSRIVEAAELLDEAVRVAQRIASFSLPAVMAAKEAVGRANETTLAEGIRFERRLFYSLFATLDQKEGMAAFLEKREPQFRNR